MKTTTLAPCLFFLFCASLQAQIDCNKFLEQGKKAARQENYELAMNSFNSARRCGDQTMGELVDKEVAKLFNAINKKKVEAERERLRAEEQRIIAEQEKLRAEEQTKIVQAARDSIAVLLQKFEAVSAEIVDAIAREANQIILKMNYAAAADKLRTAAAFNKSTGAFIQAVQETAFFWTESGKLTQAADLLRDTRQGAVPETRDALRNHLKKMDASHYAELEKRYFGDMVPIKGGTFKLGRDKEEGKEGTDAEVSDFYIASTETTFWQYGLFCAALGREISEKSVPSWGYEGHDPIINVTWYDAVVYANWLSVLRGRKSAYSIDSLQQDTMNLNPYGDVKWIVRPVSGANGYRLPTEAEWEYAARSGQDFRYAGTNDDDRLGEFAWYSSNSGGRTHPVAGKKPNNNGLYDISGNVWEWCWDWYGDYPENPAKDYLGPKSGWCHVYRGGSWFYDGGAADCRITDRGGDYWPNRIGTIGFRLALTP